MVALVFGEILWDELPSGRLLGGAPCNLAYRLHSLGQETRLVTRVGADSLGSEAIAKLQKLGMDCSLVQIDPERPTGTVSVTLDDSGKPDYVIHPGVAYDFIEWTEVLQEQAKAAEVIVFGTLAQRSFHSANTLKRLLSANPSALRFLDLNLRKDCYTKDSVVSSLELTQIVKMNDEEAREVAAMVGFSCEGFAELTRKFIERFSLSECVITFGEKGAYAALASGTSVYAPGNNAIEVKDTIGAGDAFSACYLKGILDHCGLEERCIRANRLAGKVAQQSGATEEIESIELEAILSADLLREQVFEEIPPGLCAL